MKKMIRLFFFTLILLTTINLQAQKSDYWTPLQAPQEEENLIFHPAEYELFQLDFEALQQQLSTCTVKTGASKKEDAIAIDVPILNGSFQEYNLFETPIMEAELQAKYPNIRTYTGYDPSNPRRTIKIDIGPGGFHAMIFSNEASLAIGPAFSGDTDQYMVFSKTAIQHDEEAFHCTVDHGPTPINKTNTSLNPTGTELRTYRLAMGATGEYSSFHGGTKALALAAIVTTMNRVNGIYERDFTITMILVNNTDTLIYLDPDTDPYTNNNLGNLLGENQALCDDLIGTENYDIGHVFGTAGGGLAAVGVVCGGAKARGGTGLGSPQGDVFDVDYVSHEIGHQFSGGHTFNNCGSQSGIPYEPGSGVTIMAYAGLCGANNLQPNSIDQFHVANYDQIIFYSQTANGNSCPQITPTNNTPPIVEVPEGGFYIPYATPFELTGSAFDAEGDSLTYCWEQYDLGPSVHPDSAVGNAPLFRSWQPVNTPTRIFPRIEDLVTNSHTIGELLPQFGRELNFRMTVRDNKAGGGGVDYAQLTFFAADSSGHFKVVSPNGGQIWTAGQIETIYWDVANSDQNPVNCQKVNVWLSEDGGYTYPHLIAADRDNNGSTVITVPNIPGDQIRIKVKAADNVFFDISDQNNIILPAANPDFVVTVDDPTLTICGDEAISFSIGLDTLLGFQEPVNLDVLGTPLGSIFTFSINDIVPPGNVGLIVTTTADIIPGNYTFTLQATSNNIVKNIPLTIKVRAEEIPAISLLSPFNGSTNVDLNSLFTWNPIPWVTGYTIEIADQPDFANLIFSASNITQTSYSPEVPLNPNSIYFWRVKGENPECGIGQWSPVYSFQTELLQCGEYASTDVPVSVSGSGTPTEYSELEITQDILLTDVDIVDLRGSHTWMADLHLTIIGPEGDSVVLFKNICGDQDDFYLSFDDDALSSDIPCPPTDSMTYIPDEPLSLFVGSNALGTWRMKIFDDTNQDGGALEGWTLRLCGPPINMLPPSISITSDTIESGATLSFSNDLISGDCTGGVSGPMFTIVSLPQYGILYLDGVVVEIGTSFNQSDIDNGLFTYVHNGIDIMPDQFEFIMACENSTYIGGLVYEILLDEPVATTAVSQTEFKLFPNPASKQLILQFEGIDSKDYRLDMVDLLGRMVHRYNIQSATSELDISHLSEGLYFCRVYEDEKLIGVEKITVVR